MAGIIEKSSNGLFENELEFVGEYATMAKYLKEDTGIFTTLRDVYIVSMIVGYINQKTGTADESDKNKTASIFADALSKKKKDLRMIYRMIMLLKEEKDYTLDDYKNRAFRDDPDDHADIIRANMTIVNAYACGGVQYLYDMFSTITRVEDIIDTLYHFVHDFCLDIGLLSIDEELPDFDPDFN